jgi:hypothetical protein
MKTQTAILLVVSFLLLGGTALAQTGGPGPQYTVQAGTAASESYTLTSLALHHAQDDAWHASGSAAGGSYRLLSLTGSGPFGNCCCTYLPLILRNK